MKKRLAILKIQPINFSILNEKEQSAIVQTFQKFLNSLDFPIQILMTTTELELENYFNTLEKRVKETVKTTNNKIYKKNLKSYKEHINKVIEENKVMNRNFYIIIRESITTDLEIQVSVIQEKLENLNIKSKRLKDKELKELLINFFNTEEKDKEPEATINEENLLHYLACCTWGT